jgi:hypothetical protein
MVFVGIWRAYFETKFIIVYPDFAKAPATAKHTTTTQTACRYG